MHIEENSKPRLDVMLDMETVSLAENAGILSLSMVPFSRDGSVDINHERFYRVVDLSSCFMAGMDMVGCQEWWMKQDPKAISNIVNATKEPISTVINKAYYYLSALSETYELIIWSRGIDFDFPKLEWCFRKFVEKENPYKYYNKRDVRTWLSEAEIDESQVAFEGVKHNSLDDNLHQIKLLQESFRTNRLY